MVTVTFIVPAIRTQNVTSVKAAFNIVSFYLVRLVKTRQYFRSIQRYCQCSVPVTVCDITLEVCVLTAVP